MEKRTPASVPTMYCNNCGAKGHLFRTCKDPILSCGIILIDSPTLPITDFSSLRILMIRRKDSMSFAEFMRGKYDPKDTEYVSKLIRNMTLKEQALFASESFETLWKMLWGDDKNSPDFLASKEKFETLNRLELMRANLSDYIEPEWGFPKGRRMRGETDMDCAIREFTEETNIPRSAYLILKNMLLEETFTGLNEIRYKHVYFIGLLVAPEQVQLTQKFTAMQRKKVSGIGWKTISEIEQLIRPHYTERRVMLRQLADIVSTFEAP